MQHMGISALFYNSSTLCEPKNLEILEDLYELWIIVKINKSQKHFSWNSIAQKTNEILDKILP